MAARSAARACTPAAYGAAAPGPRRSLFEAFSAAGLIREILLPPKTPRSCPPQAASIHTSARTETTVDADADTASMTTQPPLFLSREALRLGSDRELRHRRASGSLTRIGVGVYVDTERFAALSRDEQYRTRVRAAALRSDPASQFSHDSAAALWRLPSIGPWPRVAHQLRPTSVGGTSRVDIRHHAIGLDPDARAVDGILVSSLSRTVIDMAASTPFVRSVAMADHALRLGCTTEDLERAIRLRESSFGISRARSVAEFASELAASPGESLSRVQFLALGYPTPELQVSFCDEQGFAGDVDFYFRDLDLIVEFDGRSKYGPDREFQTGLSLEQILLKEKDREDRLRRLVRSFARIIWALASDRRALANHLRPHGLIEKGRSRKLFREPFSAV